MLGESLLNRRSKRGKVQVYGDILKAIYDEALKYGNARLTRVQWRAKVPCNRFRRYMSMLTGSGLVKVVERNGVQGIELTEKGFHYLNHYMSVKPFLARLDYIRVKY